MQIAEMEHKIQKMFFVFQIIAFELGVANSRNLERAICQTPVRFYLSLRYTFSKSTSLGMTKKHDKSALM